MNEQPRRFLERVWRSVRPAPSLTSGRDADHLIDLCDSLLSERGEVSSARIGAEAVEAYDQLTEYGREIFFNKLVDDHGANASAVTRAIDVYRGDPSAAHLAALHTATESRRQELFRRLNTAAGGTRLLVRMRADLLRTLAEHPERSAVDSDLKHLFRSWFNRGFLVLQRIEWRTSALILERLIQYEAVHQIQGWDDLRRRLEKDRRCYAFFHPALPDEPLIFIEAALTAGILGYVRPLLDPQSTIDDPQSATVAFVGQPISNPRRDSRLSTFAHSEELAIEAGNVVQEPGPPRYRLSGNASFSVVVLVSVPPVRRDLRDEVVAAQQRLPQFVRRLEDSGERAAHRDDSNRNSKWITHVRSPLLKL